MVLVAERDGVAGRADGSDANAEHTNGYLGPDRPGRRAADVDGRRRDYDGAAARARGGGQEDPGAQPAASRSRRRAEPAGRLRRADGGGRARDLHTRVEHHARAELRLRPSGDVVAGGGRLLRIERAAGRPTRGLRGPGADPGRRRFDAAVVGVGCTGVDLRADTAGRRGRLLATEVRELATGSRLAARSRRARRRPALRDRPQSSIRARAASIAGHRLPPRPHDGRAAPARNRPDAPELGGSSSPAARRWTPSSATGSSTRCPAAREAQRSAAGLARRQRVRPGPRTRSSTSARRTCCWRTRRRSGCR